MWYLDSEYSAIAHEDMYRFVNTYRDRSSARARLTRSVNQHVQSHWEVIEQSADYAVLRYSLTGSRADGRTFTLKVI